MTSKTHWKQWIKLSISFLLIFGLNCGLAANHDNLKCSILNPNNAAWDQRIKYEIGPGSNDTGPVSLQCTTFNYINASVKWYQCKGYWGCDIDEVKKKLRKNKCFELDSTRSNKSSTATISIPRYKQYGCIVFNYSYVGSEFLDVVKYDFTDKCETRTPEDNVKWSLGCSYSEEHDCHVSPIRGLEIRVSLTRTAFLDISMQWDRPPKNEKHFYGYYFVLMRDQKKVLYNFCLTTVYNSSELRKYSFYIKNGRSHLNLTTTLKDYLKFESNYTLIMRALPYSESINIPLKILSAVEMCKQYTKQKNEIPLHCFMVQNLTLTEQCDTNMANISWVLPKNLPIKDFLNYSILEIDKDYIKKIPHDTNYHVINTKIKHIDRVHVHLVDKNGKKALGAYIDNPKCSTPSPKQKNRSSPTPTSASQKPTKSKLNPQSNVLQIGVAISLAVLLVAVLAGLIYFFRKRKPQTNTQFNVDENREVVLIVYPVGCKLLDKFVYRVASLINDLHMVPIAECIQTDEVAPNVAGFYFRYYEQASRIVMICTEPVNTANDYHNTFRYTYFNMIEEQCMRKGDKKKVTAIYLSPNERENIPPLLKERSFLLSDDLENFLIAVCKWRVGPKNKGFKKAKKSLQLSIDRVLSTRHSRCSKDACKKGELEADDKSRAISMSELTEQFSQYSTSTKEPCHLDINIGQFTEGRSQHAIAEGSSKENKINNGCVNYGRLTSIEERTFNEAKFHSVSIISDKKPKWIRFDLCKNRISPEPDDSVMETTEF